LSGSVRGSGWAAASGYPTVLPARTLAVRTAPRLHWAPVPSLHIVLVEPEIHWNTGNIGRTSLAVGATLHLVEPLGFTLEDRHLRRAGLDYWPRVRLRLWPSWPAIEAELPQLGAPFFFTAQAPHTLWEIDFPGDVVVVFGRESVGLPSDILTRYADRTARIPMVDPGLRSLNISTAAGVVVYEVARQWQRRV
jgi:tRNA (cytidine/uridine-2'-O-)-methyltransferase